MRGIIFAMTVNRWLVVAPRTLRQRLVTLGWRLCIGRECVGASPDERLLLDDPQVSRNHCELRLDGARRMTLSDSSTNGTFVNGSRLRTGESAELFDNDRIRVGGVEMVFQLSRQTADAKALRQTVGALPESRLTVAGDDLLGALSQREREILALIAQGRSNTGIAKHLHISERTVEAHIANIMRECRLPASSVDNRRVQAVLAYLRVTSAS